MPVPSNYRWLFTDPVAVTTYRVPINPNRMTSPYPPKQLSTAQSIRVHWRIRRDSFTKPHEWTFSGVIRDIDHHDALVLWSQKQNPFTIDDHLGRTFNVVSVSFKPNEKRPTARVTARYDYDFTVLVLGEV